MFNAFLRWNLRRPLIGLLAAMVVAGAGVSRGLELPIRLSLADLLPENRESVLDLQAVSKEVGGTGYLIVLVGPMDRPESLLPAISKTLEANPQIRYTFYERESYVLRNKALYLMPEKEFSRVLEAGRIILNDGRRGLLDLGLETEKDRELNLRRARTQLRKLADREGERYFRSADGKYAMLLAKPVFDSEDLGLSKQLIVSVEEQLKKTLPEGAPAQLVGRYIDKVNDTRQIERDIEFTSLLSLLGVALILVLGLGSFRAAIMTIFAVTIAMAWTLGAAHLLVGQINILTGFLLAILGGMGVEYGVHLVRRYYQEAAAGSSKRKALEQAYLQTGRALGSAAITSSAAFLILSFSDFRGFSELGIIAGFGIISIYTVYILVFPSMGWLLRTKPRFDLARAAFGFYPFSKKMRWLIPPIGLLLIYGAWNAEFEYNFKRMHNLSKDTQARNQMVTDLFGRSLAPAALLAASNEQALELERWLSDPERKNDVSEALSLHRLVPSDMQERYEEIERIASRLGKLSDSDLAAKTGMDPKSIRQLVEQEPYVRNDLPPQLRDAFGASGRIVVAYPARDIDQADVLRDFSALLGEARTQFPGVKVGSEVRIFSEILDHITHDGLVILLVFLAGAFFVMGLDFRNFYDALDLQLQLVVGIFLLVGLMGLFGERFSILNIAMVPAVLAAGIDMGVHVRHREREGYGALPSARFVAQAVHLSALTTIVGFGSLFFAEAGLLKGIAWISVLGQLGMYLVCMVFWPVYRGEKLRAQNNG
jgi:uncharacterized protein